MYFETLYFFVVDKPWQKSEKPWCKSVCADFYIFSTDEPSLRTVSERSGRSLRTLKDWSSKDGWRSLRRDYQEKVFSEFQDNLIKSEADRLSEEFLALNQKHRDVYGLIRQISTKYLTDVARGHNVENFDVVAFQRIASVFAQAVEGERKTYNADLIQDKNRAFQVVLRDGYEISCDDKTWRLDDFEDG